AIPLAGCNSCGNKDDGTDKGNEGDGETAVTLQSISVDASKAKTEYFVGDEFTSEGIVVTATFSNSEDPVTLNTNEYTVDSSAFNKAQAGTYAIKVSSTYENVTKDASYNVTVNKLPDFDGLEVTLTEGTEDTFTLTAEKTTVEIDTTKIVVKEINEDGTVGDEITEYTTKLFNGQEEVELTDGKAMVGAGAYAIWAEKASDTIPGFTRKGFVLVYVNDAMTNFELKGGTFTQGAGIDVISKTWTFTATYTSGATREISSDVCDFAINTSTIAANASTVVSYTDYNAKGEDVTMSVNVTYSITMPYGQTLNYVYDYSAIDYSEMPGDKTDLTQSDLKGVNSFLEIGTGTVQYRNKTEWGAGEDVIEIKKEALYVTFIGTGTITIGFSSNSGKNESSVGLMEVSSKKYIEATFNASSAKEDPAKSNTYIVSGSVSAELTFTITKPGRYVIVAAVNKEGYDRSARIHSIVMQDVVPDARSAKNVNLSDIEYNANKGVKA
ncbi:MAG: bacterial Ig-like domain-containing protein, partial [Clostridia bacterium]|nr:bacterial Ig-like domain-containing protein [Clostridia bacterium]